MDPTAVLLTGRVAVVTGAGAGIGKGIALTFARFGARVAILERDEASGRATADAITGAGGDAIAVPTDIREGDAVEHAIQATIDRFQAIDILVNNVGGTFQAPFAQTPPKGWDALIRANLTSVLHATHAVAPRMIAHGRGGSIINIATIEAVRAAPGYAVYAAAKAGVLSFTQTMALELSAHQIRVNAIAPDVCMTEGLAAMLPASEDTRLPHVIPLGRVGQPDDIAGAAVFLASDLSRYMTGTILHVDGGTQAAGGWYRHPHSGAWTLGPPRA